ncbi:TadE/TadG family type IV pilus assembly protein, partial [Brevundimonas sp.]
MLRIVNRNKCERRGSIAVEFALIAPILLFMMIGMIVYGGWFWLAHSVQSLAYESARASLGGLDAAER